VLEILRKEADKKNSNLDITKESEIDVIKSARWYVLYYYG